MEEHKAGSFVQMLAGLSRLGLPLTPRTQLGRNEQGVVMELESWPLIQARSLGGMAGDRVEPHAAVFPHPTPTLRLSWPTDERTNVGT